MLLAAACSRETEGPQLPNEEPGEEQGELITDDNGTVDMITVTMPGFSVGFNTTRAEGEQTNVPLEGYDWAHPEKSPYDTPDNLFPKEFVEGKENETIGDGSLLYIAQYNSSTSPKFPGDVAKNGDEWNFENIKDNYPNIYIYRYQANPNATWQHEYNFIPHEKSKAIDWRSVRQFGSDGNAFKFYAYFFPGGKPSQADSSDGKKRYWHVGQWQSTYDYSNNWSKDIFGAYHATPSLYSRMRFKLFHLMCYVRVTLYVPVEEPIYDTKDDSTVIGYSGFGDNAFENNDGSFGGSKGQPGIYIGERSPKVLAIVYNVNYSANPTSDTAPLVTPGYASDGYNTSSNPASVNMYLHRELDGVGKNGESEIFEIDISKFKKSLDKDEKPKERVRRYEFSGIIPPQLQSKILSSDNSNILTLILKTFGTPPYDEDDTSNKEGTKMYYLKPSSLNLKKGDISFSQGELMHYYLYVPRSGNNTLVIKANVLPWEHTVTDMTVIEDEQ